MLARLSASRFAFWLPVLHNLSDSNERLKYLVPVTHLGDSDSVMDAWLLWHIGNKVVDGRSLAGSMSVSLSLK